MTKWFEHEKDKARGFRLKPPYDNIFIGCDPRDGMTQRSADFFDVFMNVSDTACSTFEPSRPGQHMHWYPVNEMGLWNLSFIFWLKTILDYHYEKGHKIYLHCHAGAYRSPSTGLLWLLSRGCTRDEALEILNERGPAIFRIWESNGNIPKLTYRVFEKMKDHPTWSLGSILHEVERRSWNREIISGDGRKCGLLHKYFWFYYKPKWWARGQWRTFHQWFSGEGWRDGEFKGCTYRYKRKHFWAWAKDAKPAKE